jgi:hypothetical protein
MFLLTLAISGGFALDTEINIMPKTGLEFPRRLGSELLTMHPGRS